MTGTGTTQELVQQLADFRTRAAARRTLLQIGKAAAPALTAAAADPEKPENMRWAAITLLAACKASEAGPTLLQVARSQPGLRGEAIRALETMTGLEIGDDLEQWERALQDPEAHAAQLAETPGPDRDAARVQGYIATFKDALADLATELHLEEEGYLYIRLQLEGGRKQQLVVTFDSQDADGQPQATIYTECGTTAASHTVRAAVQRRNATVAHGRFDLEDTPEGGIKVVMREDLPAAQITPERLREVVSKMAAEADALELELTGADHI